jgi:hypothetical protein
MALANKESVLTVEEVRSKYSIAEGIQAEYPYATPEELERLSNELTKIKALVESTYLRINDLVEDYPEYARRLNQLVATILEEIFDDMETDGNFDLTVSIKEGERISQLLSSFGSVTAALFGILVEIETGYTQHIIDSVRALQSFPTRYAMPDEDDEGEE